MLHSKRHGIRYVDQFLIADAPRTRPLYPKRGYRGPREIISTTSFSPFSKETMTTRLPKGVPEAPPQVNHPQGHYTCETQPAFHTQANISYLITLMSSKPLYLPTVPSHISSESVLKCLLTNTVSLTDRIPEFHQLALDTNPYLICITETWLTSEIPDGELLITGFNLYRTDSIRGRAGGVGVYAPTLLPPLL